MHQNLSWEKLSGPKNHSTWAAVEGPKADGVGKKKMYLLKLSCGEESISIISNSK